MRIFYSPHQAIDVEGHISPSKPRLVFDAIVKTGRVFEIGKFEPLKQEDFYRCHSKTFVDDLFALRVPSGFASFDPTVIEAAKWLGGSLVAACNYAAKNRKIGISLSSGFHHVAYSGPAQAFCTLNSMMLSCIRLLDSGLDRILVIDADAHHGDTSIIDHLKLHDRIHYITGISTDLPLLKKTIRAEMKSFKPDFILAQLAMDVMQGDPLCPGPGLSLAEIADRDEFILRTAKNCGIGVGVCSGGGYSLDHEGNPTPVIRGHLNTFLAALKVEYGVKIDYLKS